VNYFPFHVGDYAAHTAHLEPMEDLAYRRMLDLYYLRECSLPHEPAEVARLIRMRANVAEVEAVLREFFTHTDGCGWSHARCEAEIAKMQDKQAKAKASAHASVNARQANAQRTLNERSTHVELPTPTPTPTPEDSVAKATDAAAASAPVADAKPNKPPKSAEDMAKSDLWQAAVSVLEAGGCPKSQCRTFMGKLVQDYTLLTVQQAVAAAVSVQPADAREYLKATCQRLKGERKDPVTVASDAAEKTAAFLAAQSAPKPGMTEEQRAALAAARRVGGTASLRAVG